MSLLNPAMYCKYRKNPKVRHLVSLLTIILSGFLQAFTLKVFIEPSNLLSSGFLGVSILIHQIAEVFGLDISISSKRSTIASMTLISGTKNIISLTPYIV